MAPVNRDNKKIEGFNVVSIPSEYSIKNSDGSFKKDFKMDLDGYIELKQFSSKEEVECYNDQKLIQILTWPIWQIQRRPKVIQLNNKLKQKR